MGAIHGLIYVFLIPPWQHYDEPTHFEHAWLIANRSGFPEIGDYDLAMQREVAASMVEHDFFKQIGGSPDLLSQDEPIRLGYSELRHPPLYYVLVSLPLRVLPYANLGLQLRMSRLFSWSLYLLTLWISYQVARKLAMSFLLRMSVPGFIAILPAFADLMSSVNNDVAAVAAFSLFLLASVHLLIDGFSVLRVAWVIGTAVLCLFTKNTVAPAVLLVPLLIFMRLCVTRGKFPWCIGIIAGCILIGLVATLSWGDAAYWYRGIHTTVQQEDTRCVDCGAPVGESALHLTGDGARKLRQYLPEATVSALQGKIVTLGGWVWANQKIETRSPVVFDGVEESANRVDVDPVPSFFSLTTVVDEDADRLSVELILDPAEADSGVNVYYDGLFLMMGRGPDETVPVFDQPTAETGIWGSRRFSNYLRNGSAETPWPRVRPWVEENTESVLPWPHSAAVFLASVLDWERTSWLYGRVSWNLLRTFWAKFAWGQIAVAEPFYYLALALTISGVVGGTIAVFKAEELSSSRSRGTWLFLILSGLLIWLSSLMRFHPLLGDRPFIPAARYVYPAIIPTTLLFIQGWGRLWEEKRWRTRLLIIVLGLTLLLSMASLWTVVDFYYL